MKAMILDKDLNFLWTDVADPVRKEGEVVIAVKAAAENLSRRGEYFISLSREVGAFELAKRRYQPLCQHPAAAH